ncbi:MAG: MerR family transcriptional regulator [candidate division KSB1 bacterium]|nr:MerR family transcriptional regulator [candidate division KSB1 bacterium]
MNKEILTTKEILEQLKLDSEVFQEILKRKMIKPIGTVDENVPVFEKRVVQQLTEIMQFQSMGYSIEDIEKILKKVGLPSTKQAEEKSHPSMRLLTVGELATRVNVNPRTIKYWEERGIIEPDTRSEGGFRLYAEHWVYLCNLISDLQLFGYTLEEIKEISDLFRDFLAIQKSIHAFPPDETRTKLQTMRERIQSFFDKMNQFKEGIHRWEELLKKKEKEIKQFENRLNQLQATKAAKEKKT